ncbi:hypothetical protein EDC04DRAFT_3147427 [Pisolithus marmoratus]|nr:hypothetical protein EDC04DRAFT_3147427 [Pisolithus marmoratus]
MAPMQQVIKRHRIGGAFFHQAMMHSSPDKSFLHHDYPNTTVPWPTFLGTGVFSKSYTLDGAVGDTYMLPPQPKLVCNAVNPTGPGEGGSGPSLPGLVRESSLFSDSVQNASESKLVHSSVARTPNNATLEAELEPARIGGTCTVLPENAAQVVNRVYEVSCGARAPVTVTQHTNCRPTRCLYLDADGTLCLQEISCASVPSHLAGHGIKNRSRKEVIQCKWKGCAKAVVRHTFVRHIREAHLGHARGASVQSSEDGSRQGYINLV